MISSTSRARLIGIVVLLIVFAAGIAVGLAADRLTSERRMIKVVAPDMSSILDKLDLTTKQRSQARAIVERRAPSTETMMRELGEHLRLISDSLDRELRTVLTPIQQARLDSLRSGQRLLLKRKAVGSGGASVTDTIFPRRDSMSRP